MTTKLSSTKENPVNGRTRRWVSTLKTAEYLGCGERTVRRMIAGGQIPAYRVNARLLRIDLNEVDATLSTPIPSATPPVRGGGA